MVFCEEALCDPPIAILKYKCWKCWYLCSFVSYYLALKQGEIRALAQFNIVLRQCLWGKKSQFWGSFVAVLSQIVFVACCYNESRSTLYWLVDRVNVLGTYTGHQRFGSPRVISVPQDIVVRQRH